MIDGFETRRLRGDGVMIDVAIGGSGPPLLLLHGYPQTKVMWHRVAPGLAERFTCVCPDLRGYGASDKPRGGGDHATYSKRALARDMVAVMDGLGFARFGLIGHDRGARVSHRLAMDHPDRVERLALLDIAPTLDVYQKTERRLARIYFHWFFLIQAEPLPERLIAGDPDLWVERFLGGLGDGLAMFDPRAVEAYKRAFRDPAAIHASCEDYRAGATIDLEHDKADRAAGRVLTMPTLILWGSAGALPALYDVMDLWRARASDVSGRAIESGHFLAEHAPQATLEALLGHFA